MANRRNNKQHPLGVVIPIEDEDVEEEQSPPVEDAVITLVDAYNMGIEITKGLCLGLKPSSEIDEP